MIEMIPCALVVNASVAAETIAELIALAKPSRGSSPSVPWAMAVFIICRQNCSSR